jgi:hypothetical protein
MEKGNLWIWPIPCLDYVYFYCCHEGCSNTYVDTHAHACVLTLPCFYCSYSATHLFLGGERCVAISGLRFTLTVPLLKHSYNLDCILVFNHLSAAQQTKILLLFAVGDGHHC